MICPLTFFFSAILAIQPSAPQNVDFVQPLGLLILGGNALATKLKPYQKARVYRGWDMKDVIKVPKRPFVRSGIRPEDFARGHAAGLSSAMLRYRLLRLGMTMDQAVAMPVRGVVPFYISHQIKISQKGSV
jgi:hypothetical protein